MKDSQRLTHARSVGVSMNFFMIMLIKLLQKEDVNVIRLQKKKLIVLSK